MNHSSNNYSKIIFDFISPSITVVLIFLTASLAFSQTAGDYRSRISGGWSDNITWEIYNGSNWELASNPPTGDEVITIQSGHAVDIATGVSLTGTLTISSGAGLTISGSSTTSFRFGRIYNYGITTLTGTGGIMGGAGAIFDNLSGATFDVQSDAGVSYDLGGGGGITFNNAGTFRKSSGSGATTFSSGTPFNNTGTVEVQSGTLLLNSGGTHTGSFSISSEKYLNFGGGAHSIGDGASFSGAGAIQVTGGSFNATGTSSGATIASGTTLNFLGGDMGGSGKLTMNGTMNWSYSSGSSLETTSLTISSGASLTISGSSSNSFRFGRIYNHGTATLTGTGGIMGGAGAIFDNLSGATFDIQSDADVSYDGGGGGGITFNNAGTFRKSSGSGETIFSGTPFNNTGTVEVQSGTLLLNSGGTHTGSFSISSGKYLNFGGGTHTINSNVSITGAGTSQFTAGVITVNPGYTLTVMGALFCGTQAVTGSGGFTLSSGATLGIGSPAGITSSEASGNIQTTGTRSFSTGANYTYNGSTAQVTGNGLPSTINNLTINNSAGVTLTNSVNANGALNLNGGNLTTGSNTIVIGTSASEPGSLSRTAGTVVGNVKRWFAASTVSDVIFPIGTSSHYRPISISFTAAPASGGTLLAKFIGEDPGDAGLPLNEGGTEIENAGIDGYWEVDAGDGLSGGTYNIGLTACEFAGVTDCTTLRVLKRTDSESNWDLQGTHAEGTGTNENPTAKRNDLTSFSQFGIGSSSDNALPVELTSFTASQKDNSIILNWSTATEVNNYGFEIERFVGTQHAAFLQWETIGFINGHGNSNSPKYYSFIDNNVQPGKYSYRLKQIDFDGAFEYSETVGISLMKFLQEFALEQNYPNPFNPVTTIKFTIPDVGEQHAAHLHVYNILGREVATLVNGKLGSGKYEIEFDGSNLSSGIYYYILSAGSYRETKKMLLLK